jgi:uncharacterized membrane protein
MVFHDNVIDEMMLLIVALARMALLTRIGGALTCRVQFHMDSTHNILFVCPLWILFMAMHVHASSFAPSMVLLDGILWLIEIDDISTNGGTTAVPDQ